MNSFEKGLIEDTMRCHLKALIQLCGDKIPHPLKEHPDVASLASPNLVPTLNLYTAFLRSRASL